MAKFFDALAAHHLDFIHRQHMFFTGTAPEAGRINVSPKGMDSFRILSDKEVAYLDLTGSGNETAAHLRQNGRITLMFCSVDQDPLILRIYGQGTTIRPTCERWDELIPRFPALPGIRQIISVAVDSVQTSCGYSVPLFDYQGERETLSRWADKKGPEGIRQYWRDKNVHSIDGLPTGLLDEEI